MSWLPGVGPVKDVDAHGVSKGLSSGWSADTSSVSEIKKSDFWDIMDNPLYQAAAEAKGYNWDEWLNEAKSKVGHGPGDWVYAEVVPGTTTTVKKTNATGQVTGGSGTKTTPGKWEWMPKAEAKDRGLTYTKGSTARWRNKKTGDITTEGNPYLEGSEHGIFGRGIKKLREKWDDEHEEIRDWGIHDFEIAEDIDVMNKWLDEIVGINDHLHPIIREGPKGEHYGISGDIWEHYGLDKEPEPPKELEWDSYDKKMQLATTVRSSVSYSTPEGLDPIDLHSD